MLGRREFVAGCTACLLAPNIAIAQADIIQKTIPSSGKSIPAIGMGSWLTFDVGTNQKLIDQRIQVLKTFFEMGGRMIDSSPMYGSSQSVIGRGLQHLNDRPAVFAADKVWTQGRAAGRKQIQQSKQRWSVDRFDLLQVHNLVDFRAHLETLFEMRAKGDLNYVGITSYAGLRYDEIEQIMSSHPIDFVQITYNLADRDAENRILPLALEKGIAVIANRPFRQGALINHVMKNELPELAAEIGAQNWAQLLLKFIVSHPAITTAIPATRRVDHMRENMGALLGSLPDTDLRKRMTALI